VPGEVGDPACWLDEVCDECGAIHTPDEPHRQGTSAMNLFAVTAVGSDRPGIVAAVTGAFVEHGCNLEDTSMTILRGHFAMMLIVAAPADVDGEELEAALAVPAAAFDLVVAVRPIDETPAVSAEGESWNVAVYGADRPGIVHRVATVLASSGANVVDLTTRVIGDADRPVYAMVLDITIPAAGDAAELQRALHELAAELGVECSLHPSDADIL
jgi:glycine cleavage system transcriptional repressor